MESVHRGVLAGFSKRTPFLWILRAELMSVSLPALRRPGPPEVSGSFSSNPLSFGPQTSPQGLERKHFFHVGAAAHFRRF